MKFFSIFNKRPLDFPAEGEKEYRSLKDYTNDELIYFINCNESTDLHMMSGILSEILRRMNEKKPLLNEENKDLYVS